MAGLLFGSCPDSGDFSSARQGRLISSPGDAQRSPGTHADAIRARRQGRLTGSGRSPQSLLTELRKTARAFPRARARGYCQSLLTELPETPYSACGGKRVARLVNPGNAMQCVRVLARLPCFPVLGLDPCLCSWGAGLDIRCPGHRERRVPPTRIHGKGG